VAVRHHRALRRRRRPRRCIDADPLLRAITGHFAALWGIGTLLVLAAATIAFQIILGFLGIAATIAAFAVLGSPSVDGAHPYQMRPGFWRTIGTWLPNGAGVDAVRRVVYLGSHGFASRQLVIAIWAAAGAVLATIASHRQRRPLAVDRPTASLTAAPCSDRAARRCFVRAADGGVGGCVASNDRHFGGTRSSA
jgi:hypothetical protein